MYNLKHLPIKNGANSNKCALAQMKNLKCRE